MTVNVALLVAVPPGVVPEILPAFAETFPIASGRNCTDSIRWIVSLRVIAIRDIGAAAADDKRLRNPNCIE